MKSSSHIESHYHVRHNHGFLMAVAGLVVNVSHVGVKGVRTAIFDDQQLIGSSDREFDEVMRKTLKGGWQPVVRHYSRRSGECTYIYARTEGKELKVLVANLEPNEAVVFEARINPKKLEEFINEHSSPSKQQFRMRHDRTTTIRTSRRGWPMRRSGLLRVYGKTSPIILNKTRTHVSAQ